MPASLLSTIGWLEGLCIVAGLLSCLATTCIHSKPLIHSSNKVTITFSKIKQLGILFLGQSAFFLVSLFFFYFLERQTYLNPRLYAIESSYIAQMLQQHAVSLGLMPWLIYSILGIGLAYFSICLEKQPLLSRATLIKQKRSKGDLFLRNLLTIIIDVVGIAPYLFIASFALVWLCEIINGLFGWDSLFLTPFRTTFICALIILIFQRSNKQLINWMKQYQVSVGKTLLTYIIVFAFFISWLHGFSDWFTLGQESTTKGEVTKSVLAGDYTPQVLQSRVSFLIWGWWSIWTPWMASLVARASVGFTLIRAFLYSILFPLFLFTWIFPWFMGHYRGLIAEGFQISAMQIVGFSGLVLFIWLLWGKQRTMGDVSKGAMLSIGKLSQRPLNRWMMMLTLWLACYVPGWFMLGWLPMQVIVTLGGLFMLIANILFIGTWAASIFGLLASKRTSVLES